MLCHCELDNSGQILVYFTYFDPAYIRIRRKRRKALCNLMFVKIREFSSNKLHWKTLSAKGRHFVPAHYDDVIMAAIASEITSLTIVFSTVYLGTDQRNHQSSASLAFVRGIHRRPVNSPHKWPVTRKMFPFDYVFMPTFQQAII